MIAKDHPGLPIFADVDTGIDDAMALVYLFAHPDAHLIGIASTGGNTDVDQVCRNNLGLLELCGITDVEVSRGAEYPLTAALCTAEDTHGPTGLGYAELPDHQRTVTPYSAAQAWIRAAHTYPGELIGLVTGPLTNLAHALRIEPQLPEMIRRLVIMGGSFNHRGNTTAVAEWNISVDPEAAAEVFAAWEQRIPTLQSCPSPQGGSVELPIVCSLNLTENIILTPDIMNRLATAAQTASIPMNEHDHRGTRSKAANPLICTLEDAMRFYFEFHADHNEGYIAHLHDPLAAAVALDPTLIDYRCTTVDVELTGALTRGMTIADWSHRWGKNPNANVGISVDPAEFFTRFITHVGPFAAKLAAP